MKFFNKKNKKAEDILANIDLLEVKSKIDTSEDISFTSVENNIPEEKKVFEEPIVMDHTLKILMQEAHSTLGTDSQEKIIEKSNEKTSKSKV